ncbi:MAG: S8 family serine peptidase [Lachnospiraceae bacterium]|nr:S8 family serine peptidase [Lachnospiraceae bacterium]
MRKSIKRVMSVVLAAALLFGESAIVNATELIDEPAVIVEETEENAEEISEDVVSEEEIAEEISEDEISEEVAEEISEDEASEEIIDDEEEIADEEVIEDEEIVSDEEVIEDEEIVEEEELIEEDVEEEITEEESVSYCEMFAGYGNKALLPEDNAEEIKETKDHMESIGFSEGGSCVENEIIVDAEDAEIAEEYAAAFSGELVEWIDGGFALISLNADPSMAKATVADAVLASLEPDSGLPVASPNTYYYLTDLDDDITEDEFDEFSEEIVLAENEESIELDSEAVENLISAKEMLKSTNSQYQWHHDIIGSAEASAAGFTGSGVNVVVIDSGCNNSDVPVTKYTANSAYDKNKDEVAGGGHGTHVCGLIKLSSSASGMGVANSCNLSMIKVTNSEAGAIATSDILSALGMIVPSDSTESGVKADIVNMSLGSPEYNSKYAKIVKKLYSQGIAIFCAAGNTGTNTYNYPASFTGAISIAALDKNNQRAYFTNSGGKTKFAFPGVDIWSTKSGGGYCLESGTSMASPIAAGTAAVIFSAKRESITKYTGKKRVNALVSAMSKGAVKASGSNLGKGYVSIPKALGIASSTTAPATPYVFTNPAGTYASNSVDVTLRTRDNDTSIYYSLDGKTPTYKNGVISNGTLLNSNCLNNSTKITVKGAAKVTLKAIAVKNSNKKVSKVLTAKYTLKPVTGSLNISAPALAVKQGGTLQLSANFSPEYISNKKVKWSVDAASQGKGVTVDSKGKVKVAASAPNGTYKIICTSALAGVSPASKDITVMASTNNFVKTITTDAPKSKVKCVIGGTKEKANATDTVVVKATLTRNDGTVETGNKMNWVSANTKVATVSAGTNQVTIKGVSKGSTKVTGYASDGSGKKVTISVSVSKAATKLAISGTKNLAPGSSATLKAEVVTPTDASDKSFDWSVNPADQGVSVNAKGVVKASSSAAVRQYTVTATSKYNNTNATYTINVVKEKVTKIAVQKSAQVFRVSNGNSSCKTTGSIPVTVTGPANWDVKSSDEGILKATKSGSNVSLTATGAATGTVTVTVYATDTSGKKATCKVKVVNPASGLTLSVPGNRCTALAFKKTMKLQTHFVTGYGAVDSSAKKFTWKSSNEAVFTVSSSGKVKSMSYKGETVKITATATDGSGVSGSITLTAVDAISFTSALSAGYTAWGIGYHKVGGVGAYVKPKHSDGVYSGQFTMSVSGPAGGLCAQNNQIVIHNGKETYGGFFYGAKKGTYTVKMKPIDGNGGGFSVTVIVY